MKVLLCDAEARSSLSAMRALEAAGVHVVSASHVLRAISFYSRCCKEKLIYPDPASKRDVFVECIRSYVEGSDEEVLVMAFTDTTMDVLVDLQYSTAIKNFVLEVPRYEDYKTATDKAELAKRAMAIGVETPRELSKEDIDDKETAYPIILKPARTVSWGKGKRYKDTAAVAENSEEAQNLYEKFQKNTGRPPLVQEMIIGDEYGLSVLAKDGQVKALFAYKRLRSITQFGGVSSLRESIALTGEMQDIAQKLVGDLRWTGVMMIELKQNSKTGKLVLIEINARFWGSLFLGIVSGVHFPHLLYKQVSGEDIAPVQYKGGVRARHLLGDIHHYYALRMRAFTLKNIVAFCTFWQKDLHYDVLSLRDPLPGFMECRNFLVKKLF